MTQLMLMYLPALVVSRDDKFDVLRSTALTHYIPE